jgi:hypothetical protein
MYGIIFLLVAMAVQVQVFSLTAQRLVATRSWRFLPQMLMRRTKLLLTKNLSAEH